MQVISKNLLEFAPQLAVLQAHAQDFQGFDYVVGGAGLLLEVEAHYLGQGVDGVV